MPRLSVVVPVYNSERYLKDCYKSIASQPLKDWEMVAVVDGSPDGSLEILKELSSKDSRVRVVNKEKNEGIHLARMSGVEVAQGDYLFFLDADDELHGDGISRAVEIAELESCDILHVGINVIGVGVDEDEVKVFASFINGDLGPRVGREICAAAYDPSDGFVQDWRLTQRLYRTSLLKDAFSQMSTARLGRNEDGYEYFVVSCLAQRELTRNDVVVLDYYYGRGLNSGRALSEDKFVTTAMEFEECLAKIEEFSQRFEKFDVTDEVGGARTKATDLLMNDWRARVPDGAKLAAARRVADIIGRMPMACQLMRLSRDEAFFQWKRGEKLSGKEAYLSWYRLGEELAHSEGSGLSSEFIDLRMDARDHIADLESRSVWTEEGVAPSIIKRSSYESQPIRIFVTTHKDVDTFHSDILQPVQVGAKSPRRRLLWAFQDDEGENISSLNAMYCELTTQYWAWKNVDTEYYGFCHYRRYFDFSDVEHEENPYGEVMDTRICWDSQREYLLDDESIAKVVKGCDVITTGVNDFSAFPEAYENPVDLYRRSPYLHVEDLERVMEIMREMHPEYGEDADAYLSSSMSCFCNMFIMRRQLFFDYCAWLFPILERFVSEWDTSHLSHESLRTPGHLSERLLNVYLIHERRVNPGLVWKELQCVHFENPEHTVVERVVPAESHGLPVVPVVFASDDGYVPMVTATICSMLRNASTDHFYDVVVLEKDITDTHKREMRSFFSVFPNASVRFVNVWPLIRAYNLRTSNAHISVETYYRFLIQDVLSCYDKVLYLDSDLIIEGDVSELFNVDLNDGVLAAVRDIDYAGNLDLNDGERVRYSEDVLGLEDPFDYFQAGVLVLNTAGMRTLHTVEEWLEMAAEPKYIYDDQDILNAECQGRVTFLDNAWNVMINCGGRFKKVFSFAPARMYDEFMDAYRNPRIIHYAGYEKPWKPGSCDLAERFWYYARQTPYYERLLLMAYSDSRETTDQIERAKHDVIETLTTHERAVGEDSPVRGVADVALPMGSRRREVVKGVVRRLRGRR